MLEPALDPEDYGYWWCPQHARYQRLEDDCPGCLADSEAAWDDGRWELGPEPSAGDGWYLDLVARAELGQDPHHPWRD